MEAGSVTTHNIPVSGWTLDHEATELVELVSGHLKLNQQNHKLAQDTGQKIPNLASNT